jgi:hypothetical protein
MKGRGLRIPPIFLCHSLLPNRADLASGLRSAARLLRHMAEAFRWRIEWVRKDVKREFVCR